MKHPAALDNSLNLRLDYFNNPKFVVEFNGCYLKPDKISFLLIKKIKLYVTFEIKLWPFYVDNGFMLKNSFFGAVNLTKNDDPDKYSYSSISFDFGFWFLIFLLSNGVFRKNVIIFGADMSTYVHADNKKDILILGKEPVQGLGILY